MTANLLTLNFSSLVLNNNLLNYVTA